MPSSRADTHLIAADPLASVRVLRQFRLVFNAVRTHFQQVERSSGLGGAQLWALSVIESNPGIGMGALAAAMDIRQTTASNLVRGLLDIGLVESQRNGPDRRTVQLLVKPEGRQRLRSAPGPMTGVLPDALARLDPATLARLERDLASLLEVLGTDERAAHIPLAQM